MFFGDVPRTVPFVLRANAFRVLPLPRRSPTGPSSPLLPLFPPLLPQVEYPSDVDADVAPVVGAVRVRRRRPAQHARQPPRLYRLRPAAAVVAVAEPFQRARALPPEAVGVRRHDVLRDVQLAIERVLDVERRRRRGVVVRTTHRRRRHQRRRQHREVGRRVELEESA